MEYVRWHQKSGSCALQVSRIPRIAESVIDSVDDLACDSLGSISGAA